MKRHYTEDRIGIYVKELRQLIANAEQEIENINALYMRDNFNGVGGSIVRVAGKVGCVPLITDVWFIQC